MSLLPFLAFTQLAAVATLLVPRRYSATIGIGGLAVATLVAILISGGESIGIGGEPLITSAYQRLFLVLGSLCGLLLAILGYAAGWQRNIPAALLAALGWTGLALGLAEPGAALLAATVAGLAGVLVTLEGRSSAAGWGRDGVGAGARELRAVVVASALALLAFAWVDVETTLVREAGSTELVGIGLLGLVVALTLRFGAVPFHGWVGRVAGVAPVTSLPLLLAWAPAGFGIVVLGWAATTIPADAGGALGLERSVASALGVATLIGAAFAAWIQDETEHVVGYAMAQDAGFVLLALAADPTLTWGPARTFLLVTAVGKTALAAWALALTGVYGTSRAIDLAGWARRTPLLLVTLGVIVVASIGWPGSAAWESRWTLATGALPGPLGGAVFVAGLGSLLYFVRLIRIGLRAPGQLVTETAGPRISRPSRALMRERAVAPERATGPMPAGGRAALAAQRAVSASGHLGDRLRLRAYWRVNRVPVAIGTGTLIALLALAVSAGAFDVVRAAAEPPAPRPIFLPEETETEPTATPDPTATSSPVPTPSPTPSTTPVPTAEPTPSQPTVPAPTSTPVPTPTSTPKATSTYRVVSGDSLSVIASKVGTTVRRLLALNPRITARTVLRVGQRIVIP